MAKQVMKYYLVLMILIFFGTGEAFGWPWSYDMWHQPSIKPYEEPVTYPEQSVSVDGSRVEQKPREEYEEITQNPISPTEKSLKNGEELYSTLCAVCHGPEGMGNGTIVRKDFYPIDLTTAGTKGRTDGYIYAYIMYGGKVMMPNYSENVTRDEAWDIVNYVRKLQGMAGTSDENEQSGTANEGGGKQTEQESSE